MSLNCYISMYWLVKCKLQTSNLAGHQGRWPEALPARYPVVLCWTHLPCLSVSTGWTEMDPGLEQLLVQSTIIMVDLPVTSDILYRSCNHLHYSINRNMFYPQFRNLLWCNWYYTYNHTYNTENPGQTFQITFFNWMTLIYDLVAGWPDPKKEAY